MIKADTVLCHELIGLKVRILDDTGGDNEKNSWEHYKGNKEYIFDTNITWN